MPHARSGGGGSGMGRGSMAGVPGALRVEKRYIETPGALAGSAPRLSGRGRAPETESKGPTAAAAGPLGPRFWSYCPTDSDLRFL